MYQNETSYRQTHTTCGLGSFLVDTLWAKLKEGAYGVSLDVKREPTCLIPAQLGRAIA